jgi:hypothetical protein
MRGDDRRRYLLYSPALSQALALASLLRRQVPDARIVGVTLPSESLAGAGGAYDAILDHGEVVSTPQDVVLPMGALATFFLAERLGDLTIGEITLSRASLRFADKVWSLALANEIGVPTPRTWQNPAAIESWPVFFKGSAEGSIPERGIAHSPAQVPHTGAIYQEIIEREGVHGLGFLARDGELLAHFGHFERTSYPKTGGSAVIIERNDDARVLDYTRRLLRESRYSGWGLAEFKHCRRRDDFVFMEVNTKFWASWDLALANEPRFAKLLFGIDVPAIDRSSMIFLDRALRRGPGFWPRLIAAAMSGSVVRAYPGWPRQLLAGLLPESMIARAGRIRR